MIAVLAELKLEGLRLQEEAAYLGRVCDHLVALSKTAGCAECGPVLARHLDQIGKDLDDWEQRSRTHRARAEALGAAPDVPLAYELQRLTREALRARELARFAGERSAYTTGEISSLEDLLKGFPTAEEARAATNESLRRGAALEPEAQP